MSPLIRTTNTMPQDDYKMLKMKSVVENTSVSGLIKQMVKKNIRHQPYKKIKTKEDPMKTLGVFNIGINKIYNNRDELYGDHLKRKMGL